MKNKVSLLALFALAFTLVLSSCKKDDDAKPTTKTQIIGIWKLESSRWTYYENGKLEDDDTDYGTGETIEFKSDGSVIYKEGNDSDTGNWALTDGDKKILLNLDGDSDLFEIKEISSSKLVIYRSSTSTISGVSYKEESTISLKK